MARYAEKTTVSIAKSKGEIITLFEKRGASEYFTGKSNGRDFVCCIYEGLPIKIDLPSHDVTDEQDCRRVWRVMLIWLKGQFEAIDGDILTARGAFLPYLQLTDGRTVAEAAEQDGVDKMLTDKLALPAPASVKKGDS